jgi:salicylate hydroxylase
MKRARCVPIQNWDTVDGISLKQIACQNLSKASERFGAAYVAVHRVDLHEELMRLAKLNQPGGVELHLSSRVVRIDADAGQIELIDGRLEDADLIIGADGIRSVSRTAISISGDSNCSSTAGATSTGLSAFRFLVPTELLQADAAGKELLEWKTPGATLLGDPNSVTMEQERHIMWYACRE